VSDLPAPWDEPPRAVITRHGWLYAIDIQQGLTGLNEPYWRIGRPWAEAKARKALRNWNRQQSSWTVTL
jgi:hypothetical protein